MRAHTEGSSISSAPTAGTAVGAGPRAGETNRLLRALPPDEYTRIEPHLERVHVDTLELLAEVGGPVRHVYFPESAILSMLRELEDGTEVEAGAVGREGAAGIGVLFDCSWSTAKLVGQVPGSTLRVEFGALRALLPELPALRDLFGRFVLTLFDQVGQTLACNTRHSVDQRCARWLLMTHDRVGAEFHLTHAVLAQMLAVRRAGVTVALGALQQQGLIRYSRGKLTVLDRAGLEATSCECYRLNRAHYEQLLGETAGAAS